MSCFSGNKYLCNIYQKNAIKFNQYLKHITTFADFDNATFTYEKNTSTIAGANKFGIFFAKPCNTSELFAGKVGELNSEHITAYYANFFGCSVSHNPDYIEFRDNCTGLLMTYECCLPDLNCDIPPQTVSTDFLITIKCIIEKYKNFYAYMYKKTCCKDDDDDFLNCDKDKCSHKHELKASCYEKSCEKKYDSQSSHNDSLKNKFLNTINKK